MTWGDKISFLLNENLQVKRLSFLDVLKEQTDGQAENEDERFDGDALRHPDELSQIDDAPNEIFIRFPPGRPKARSPGGCWRSSRRSGKPG